MESILFDCDNTLGIRHREIDDGLALIYLLGCADIELHGITTTFGNGTLPEVLAQTRKLLDRLGRSDIPLVAGAAGRRQAPTEAARFLAENAARRPGELTLLATGPLGNLHAAKQLDPDFYSNLKRIVCMGGTHQPLQVGWRRIAELNFSADPQAAHNVLHASCPVTVMSAELCLQASFSWWDLRRIGHLSPWLRTVMRNWLVSFGLYCGVPRFYLWDLVPAVFLTHPELFDRRLLQPVATPEDLARGTLRWELVTRNHNSVNVPSEIRSRPAFMACLFQAWSII